MTHAAKAHEHVIILSMGKRFRVRAITDNVYEANVYMERHSETALIACYGPFCLIANTYSGIRYTDKDETA